MGSLLTLCLGLPGSAPDHDRSVDTAPALTVGPVSHKAASKRALPDASLAAVVSLPQLSPQLKESTDLTRMPRFLRSARVRVFPEARVARRPPYPESTRLCVPLVQQRTTWMDFVYCGLWASPLQF